ncbi:MULTISPECIES: carbohydrate ABC transporter permease [Brevibacillus]|uniref:ABC transporter permease protein n=1 Tax=Brevibacillus brevis (strain 47 / JCM 6285 / NBRC 100599) TaxID=358681 RepID=C0Z8T2_BREBN|nr:MULTISPECIES: sugar ABC transporter permease [Bacillales]NQF13616.1 sugar ABC transporter permease [Brevibacillus sp. HB1.3]NRR03791.1 sugar ABC transporter permease [Brevibacillus sp. RS1.1]OUQ86887.1 ABC transporter permease [Brevibacillus brevis]TQR34947.1 sugar ABC transporter permease [Lysinibacillus sp. SDF0063]BAH46709.1 ABC transporter permease protein [Brevibacillus brevis NBRC 100599]
MGELRAKWKVNMYAWLLLLPSLIFLLLFTFYPVIQTFILSFHQADLGSPEPFFNGIDNYKQMLEDEVFWKVLTNNIWFAIGTVPTSVALALAMALFANKALRGKSFIRTAYFYPTVVPMIAVANIWLFIYTPEYGALSHVMEWFGKGDMNWLGDQKNVMWAMIFMVIWKEAGYFMIFYLAGLQNISQELYESASMEGASSWTVFRRITFPLLMPTTMFVSIIAFTNSFKLVDHLVIMTKGGPDNASNLLLYYIYETAFSFWDQGMASALTIVMVVLLLLVAAFQFFGMDKKIHYN